MVFNTKKFLTCKKCLFDGTIPSNKKLYGSTVLLNKKLYDGTVPSNKELSDGNVLSNNRYFLKVLFDGTLKKFKILISISVGADAPVQELCRKLL